MAADRLCVGCGSSHVTFVDDVAACHDCGLRMAASMVSMDYGAAYATDDTLYGEHIKALDRFQTSPDLTSLLLPFERRIVERLGPTSGIRSIVDLGCGTGRFLRAAELAGMDAQGFEVAPILVQRLQGHGRHVQRGGIDEFMESPLTPDAVSLLEVVEHLPQPGAAIERLLARKKPKRLFVVVPDWQVRRRYDTRFAQHDVPPNHLTWWSPGALTALLGRHGYTVKVEAVGERRRSLLGHIARNLQHQPSATPIDWLRALARPPTFWLLATAERV